MRDRRQALSRGECEDIEGEVVAPVTRVRPEIRAWKQTFTVRVGMTVMHGLSTANPRVHTPSIVAGDEEKGYKDYKYNWQSRL